MTALVDATTAQHARGIATVIAGVVSELPRVDKDVLVVGGPDLAAAETASVRRLAIARTRVGRLAYQRLLLPIDVALLGGKGLHIDRVLVLDAYLPLVRHQRVRYAALVHDVLPLTHPQFWSPAKLAVKHSAFFSLRAARPIVFTSTEHNAREVRRLLGIGARVAIFGCGQLSDEEADNAMSAALPERRPYLVCVGALEPRKNVAHLLDIFENVGRHAPDLELVIIGSGRGRYVRAITDRIARSTLRERIAVRPSVSRQDALRIVAGASALLFPSLAEGFGLPVLEALALGTPVIASDLPEIRSWADDAISYASPHAPLDWVDPVLAAIRQSSEQRRAGQSFAQTYRWRSCAEALIAF
jgi:glycosyltransferase involved in cell wall biosynthesis